MFNVTTRWILDNCETTGEAMEFLRDIPKTWGIAYLIIDKNSMIVKAEAHKEKTKVIHSDDGFEFVTMIFHSPEMEKYNQIDEFARLYYPCRDFLKQ